MVTRNVLPSRQPTGADWTFSAEAALHFVNDLLMTSPRSASGRAESRGKSYTEHAAFGPGLDQRQSAMVCLGDPAGDCQPQSGASAAVCGCRRPAPVSPEEAIENVALRFGRDSFSGIANFDRVTLEIVGIHG